MTRADALKALDVAFAERIQIEFNNLGTGFAGTSSDKEKAKDHFSNGMSIHLAAHGFAVSVISEKFKE